MPNPTVLAEIAQVVDCEHKTALAAEPGTEFGYSIGTPNLRAGRIEFSSAKRVDRKTFDEWSRRAVLERGDLILAREAPVGQVAYVDGARPVCLGQRTVLIRPDSSRVDSRYLHYRLLGPAAQSWMSERAAGSTVPHLNVADVRQIPLVDLPQIDEQQRIAGVLGALDDLTDANRLEADRLDALCRCLGRQFLSALVNRPLARVDELATVHKGYSYKSSELKPGNGWLVNLKNVGRDGQYQPYGLKPLTGNHKPLHVLANGDVCVALTDLTQKREVIGRPIRVRRGTAIGDLVASLDLVIVRPGPRSTREYLYAVLDSDEFRSHALGFCNGTTVVHMASGAVPCFQSPVPKEDELRDFSDRVTLLRTAADAALVNADQLESARNELLPLLLSGRARVEDVAA